ncbi:T9SS type A sorting domain-containing protein [Fulvivirga ligni]|uniref:T9SS type A sorting domain-containing protein n=1 Tax=Fulvivirga ligni TaxID=2904246 RepID=UPI001F19C10D|nr:T9SS type A sorting domain-containing protein [Fulvivirga ligni]UII23369.1 T9SS type A sorting domain-containing protein [Fulvivirga ligni]
MKSMKLIAALLIVSSSAFATELDKTTVNVKMSSDNDVYTLYYRGEDAKKVSVEIISPAGKIVFSESIKANGSFKRPYNLSELPAGNYTLKVTDHNGTTTETIQHGNTTTGSSSINFISLRPVDKKYQLTIISDKSVAKVRIFQNGYEIYSDMKKIENGYSEVYNLDQLTPNHDYEMEVIIDGEVKNFKL